MTDDNLTVDDLLHRPNDYLREEYGEFGESVIPQVRTHDRITALLATLDQQDTRETYDLEDSLWNELQTVKSRIVDDLQGAIEDEYHGIDTDEIIEHLETIHVESQAIHDFLHSHEQEISDYGWPRPNPLTKATESEALSEDLIHALEDDPDGTTVESFVRAVEAQSFTTYQTESGHNLISTSGKHDFDIVVEPDGAYNADEIHDSIEDALADELGLTVRRLKPCNEDSVVHVGVADDHPLFQ